jgi:anti-sigma factor RsiW
MKCDDSRIYLPAYLDDELPVAESLHMQKHLAGCAACRRAQEEFLALRTALRDADLYAGPSAGFSERIGAAVRRSAKEEARSARPSWFGFIRWAPALAALLVVAAIGVFFAYNQRSSPPQLMASTVLSEHIRSLQADHLVDVPSSDHHTVKPWFQGKLDFSPPVADLAQQGWTLIGGRLDYLDGRSVAALVYQRRKHNINVFVWPGHAPDDAVSQEEVQGYQILHWNSAGMTYWVVSDLNAAELQELARALRAQ